MIHIGSSGWGGAGPDNIVPFTMKLFSLDVEGRDLLVRNFGAGRVGVGVESGDHPEASLGRGGCDQVHDDLMIHQRLPSPALTDEREQPMFDLVPLAGARRQVTDG